MELTFNTWEEFDNALMGITNILTEISVSDR